MHAPTKISTALATLATLVLLALPTTAYAGFGVSARTAGMGGVGIATAHGGEGLYYNPARTLTATRAELSLSANAYGYESLVFEGQQSISDGDITEKVDLEFKTVHSFPSAASTIIPIGSGEIKQAIGFGVFIPFGPDANADAVFAPANHPTVRRLISEVNLREYWMSGSYGIRIGPLSLGATAIGVVTTERTRDARSRTDAGFTPSSPRFFTTYSSYDGQALDLHGALGAHLALGPISIGATVRSPSFNVLGRMDHAFEFAASDTGGNYATSIELKGVGYANPQPMRLGVGLAFETGSFTLGTDAWLDLSRTATWLYLDAPVPLGRGEELEPDAFTRTNPNKLNIGIGAEYVFSESLIFRAGGFMIMGLTSLPSDAELEEMNSALATPSQSQEEANEKNNAYNAITGLNRRQSFAATLGLGYTRDYLRTDVALTAVLQSGEGVRESDRVLDGGEYVLGVQKRGISGYAVILSIGGTYGISSVSEKKGDDR